MFSSLDMNLVRHQVRPSQIVEKWKLDLMLIIQIINFPSKSDMFQMTFSQKNKNKNGPPLQPILQNLKLTLFHYISILLWNFIVFFLQNHFYLANCEFSHYQFLFFFFFWQLSLSQRIPTKIFPVSQNHLVRKMVSKRFLMANMTIHSVMGRVKTLKNFEKS